MKQLTAFFRLVRWRNLLIVFLTQWIVWICVIRPMADWSKVPIFLNNFHFFLLTLSTVLIAAAGYIINDYFDVKIDVINRPGKVIIERTIGRRFAILWHSAFNIIGLLLALYLAVISQNYMVAAIQLVCTVLLWFYSTTFKRMFVSGNVIVALLAALTVLVLAAYEPALYPHAQLNYFLVEGGVILVNPLGVIVVYAYFAFMLNWMREIVKDMEDFKGDAEEGCVTMPIKIGLRKSVAFVIILGVLTVVPLSTAAIRLFSGNWSILGLYIVIVLILPIIAWLFFLTKKATSKHYSIASRWLKIIMLLGIISLFLYYWLQYY